MDSCAVYQSSALQSKQLPLKGAQKYTISIRDDGRRKPVQRHYLFSKQNNNGGGRKRVFQTQEMSIFSETVYNYQISVNAL